MNTLNLTEKLNAVSFNDATETLLNECEKLPALLVWQREDLPEDDPEYLTAFNPLLGITLSATRETRSAFTDDAKQIALKNNMSILYVLTNFFGVHTANVCKFYATDVQTEETEHNISI